MEESMNADKWSDGKHEKGKRNVWKQINGMHEQGKWWKWSVWKDEKGKWNADK